MENTVNTQEIKEQVATLQANGSIAKARAWWDGLSKQQKAAVIGLTVGASFGIGYGAYALSVGATAGQSFWAAVMMGTVTGVSANAFALGCYSAKAVVATNDLSDLKA